METETDVVRICKVDSGYLSISFIHDNHYNIVGQ
jgi:hypothetical protein